MTWDISDLARLGSQDKSCQVYGYVPKLGHNRERSNRGHDITSTTQYMYYATCVQLRNLRLCSQVTDCHHHCIHTRRSVFCKSIAKAKNISHLRVTNRRREYGFFVAVAVAWLHVAINARLYYNER